MEEEILDDAPVEEVEEIDTKEAKKSKKGNNAQYENLMSEYEELNSKYLRVSAELQNIMRRNDLEISKLRRYEGESTFVKLLGVTDDFERALLINGEISPDVKKFLDGFEMIYAGLARILSESGVKEIECLNNNFDENLAMAVLTEASEGINPGVVTDVLQKGYMYNDKVIRPAMVKVSE